MIGAKKSPLWISACSDPNLKYKRQGMFCAEICLQLCQLIVLCRCVQTPRLN